MHKGIAILGSTGSIGTQALEVIDRFPDTFSVEMLAAGSNADLLIRQSMQYAPGVVVIGNEEHYSRVKEALAHYPTKVYCGEDSIVNAVTGDHVDLVLAAMVGFSGLKPTMEAVRNGKEIALANKETLVVAGELIMKESREKQAVILPVDSEHSAIFQCLVGEDRANIEKIILTASGGPFRGKGAEELKKVTPEEALCHPNWCMGPKVTIDSATLMNKGLEVIEARWLFGIPPERIEVVVHPQSVIHSLVQFCDGSLKAQLGLPDMKLPIQYALAWPGRLGSDFERFNFSDFSSLTFEQPDTKNFRNLAISYEALRRGGTWPCVLNASNEVAVEAFLDKKIGFPGIPEVIEKTMERASFVQSPGLDDLIESDREARSIAQELTEA